MKKIILICLIGLVGSNCFAEETQEENVKSQLDNMLSKMMVGQITIIPKISSEEEIKGLEYREKKVELSEKDKKIVKVISQASAYAKIIGDDNMNFPYEMVLLVVKKCRYFYDKEKPNISFIEYIKKDLDRHYSNCENWIIYYPAFLEEDL